MNSLEESRVLVTPRSFADYDPSLRTRLEAAVKDVRYNDKGRPLRSEELVEMIADRDGMIAGLDEINRAVMEAAPRLKVIARYGVGVDNVDLEAARQHGVAVTNTPGANASSVAELTVGLMLALARSIPHADRSTKSGRWPRLSGRTLAGKTIGLIGLGSVGGAVARRRSAFDCTLIASDPFVEPEQARSLGVELVERNVLVELADVLTLHCPLTPETRNMVNSDFLASMKTGSLLINTARGELIDEPALTEALADEQLAGAALDTLRQEPPDPDNPLLKFDQVIVTPHTGAHTDGAANAMGRMAVDDCLAVLSGDEPEHPVLNPEGKRSQ